MGASRKGSADRAMFIDSFIGMEGIRWRRPLGLVYFRDGVGWAGMVGCGIGFWPDFLLCYGGVLLGVSYLLW